VASIFGTKDIVDIEYVVAILIIIPVILDSFARFREDTTRVAGRLVFEVGVAYPIGSGQVSR